MDYYWAKGIYSEGGKMKPDNRFFSVFGINACYDYAQPKLGRIDIELFNAIQFDKESPRDFNLAMGYIRRSGLGQKMFYDKIAFNDITRPMSVYMERKKESHNWIGSWSAESSSRSDFTEVHNPLQQITLTHYKKVTQEKYKETQEFFEENLKKNNFTFGRGGSLLNWDYELPDKQYCAFEAGDYKQRRLVREIQWKNIMYSSYKHEIEIEGDEDGKTLLSNSGL